MLKTFKTKVVRTKALVETKQFRTETHKSQSLFAGLKRLNLK